MAADGADARARIRLRRTPGGSADSGPAQSWDWRSAAGSRGESRIWAFCTRSKQNHIPIDYIAGNSAGALAAIAFASGLPFEEVAKRAAALRFGVFGQWRFSWLGLASNQRLEFYPKRYPEHHHI